VKPALTAKSLPATLEEEYRQAFHDLAKRRGLNEAELLSALASEAGQTKLSAAELRTALLHEVRTSAPTHAIDLREDGPAGGSFAFDAALKAVQNLPKK